MPVLWHDSKDTSGEDLKGSETCCCMSHSTKHDKCWTFAASVQNHQYRGRIPASYMTKWIQTSSCDASSSKNTSRAKLQQESAPFGKPSQRRFYLAFTKRWKLNPHGISSKLTFAQPNKKAAED